MGDGSGMPASERSTSHTSRTITRRTVTRGVAWSAPLAAISVAAPAFASSIPCQVTTVLDNLTPGQPVQIVVQHRTCLRGRRAGDVHRVREYLPDR